MIAALLGLPALAPVHAQVAAAPGATATANGRKVLGVDDYARWRSIGDAQLSSDGRWAAYVLRFANTLPADAKPVLHIVNLETNERIEIAGATSPEFSPDARWALYSLDSIPARRGGRTGDTANATQTPAAGLPARMELRELASGKTRAWQHMTSGTFAATSQHLLLRRRAPARPAG
ncbi:MAG TPA: hypothetical protein VMN60_12325, partial [Longimicrobiales bacterium]|nr:hypothetical protein [Longimicrobiales bacterium]